MFRVIPFRSWVSLLLDPALRPNPCQRRSEFTIQEVSSQAPLLTVLAMKLSVSLLLSLILLPLMALAVKEQAHTTTRRRLQGRGGKKGKKMMKDEMPPPPPPPPPMSFKRVSTYLVCTQLEDECNIDTETVAESVSVSEDGMILVYTDSGTGSLGFLNITDPADPQGLGMVDVGGEPRSVAVSGPYALVTVNTSPDFVNPSGILVVVDIATQAIILTIDLGGQPESIAVSPDRRFAAVAIENRRDESLGDGTPPQAPPGFLVVIDTVGAPAAWTTTPVDLSGLPFTRFPGDPEPKSVSINSFNLAVVSLQENNGIAVVDLETKMVIPTRNDAGGQNLDGIDTTEDGIVMQTESLVNVLREPDGITWIGDSPFVATADEGDLDGGSRGFTIFNMNNGRVAFITGNFLDQLVARLGHYTDTRSGNRGNEPENVVYGDFGDTGEFLFVGSERSGVVTVWEVSQRINPQYMQTLPAGVGPEGMITIPSRNLVVAANEVDSRDFKFRSSIMIYELGEGMPTYPTLISSNRPNGDPIPWGAISGLGAETRLPGGILYAVQDDAFAKSRMFVIDNSVFPAVITLEVPLNDLPETIAGLAPQGEFGSADIGALVNDDYTVNLDLEGIAVREAGGLWIVSEGKGTWGDVDNPVKSLNMLLQVAMDGSIEKTILLPEEVNQIQTTWGFQGVAEGTGPYEGQVAVVFQRALLGEMYPRIGWYNSLTEEWSFFFYELDAPLSGNGGWVGLSDIATITFGTGAEFLVVERDNQGGPDAFVKKIYRIDLDQETPGTIIAKYPVRDIVPDLIDLNGPILEKVDGIAMDSENNVVIVNDNGTYNQSGVIFACCCDYFPFCCYYCTF